MKGFVFLILSFFCFSCGNEEPASEPTTNVVEPVYRDDLKNDSLYPSVFGAAHSHALLLPSDYSPSHSFPLIIFLDPQGNGALPLKKYSSITHSHGYILAGSNVSKNGMDSESAKQEILALLDECKNNLNIDPSRVYLAGFSGGARVAGTLLEQTNISGIIYCSAGFEVKQGISKYKVFVGIAGDKDMNYLEVLSTHNRLNNEGLQNRFIEYDGKHEWPGLAQVTEAADYLAIHEEIKTKRKEEGRKLRFKAAIDSEIAGHRSKRDTFKLFLSLDKKFEFLYGEPEGNIYKDTLAGFEQTHYIKEWSKKHTEVLNAEIAYQKEMAAWLETKTASFWKARAEELRQRSKSKGDLFNSNSAHRLLGYMSLVSYSITSSMIKKQDFDGAEKFCEIYRIVDPENPEQCYFNAGVKAHKGDCKATFSFLEEAVKFGFADSNRIKNETVLTPCLQDSGRLNALFKRMARSL